MLMKVLIQMCLCLFLVAMAGEPTKPSKQPPTQYINITHSDPIVGELVGPAASFTSSKKNVRFPLMIKIRGDFLPEILDTSDSL